MITFEDFQNIINSSLTDIKNIVSKYYLNTPDVITKEDDSPVTIADREIEVFLRNNILSKYPSHSIIGEEYGENVGGTDSTWIIDPIDGTYSFIHGIPLFTTLIAYTVNSKAIYGAIYQPISGELAIGDGKITLYNNAPTRVRANRDIKDATMLTTSFTSIENLHNGAAFRNLAQQTKCTRTWGDGYGYLMLVSGRADIMVDSKMKIWDYAALIPVIEGAGGVITDYEGRVVDDANAIVATTNPELHKKVISMLK